MSVNDLPAPATIEADAGRLGVPVYTLRNVGLRLAGHSTVAVGNDLCQVALSYSVLVNPEDPEDPINFVTDERLVMAAREGLREDRPSWFRERVLAMRYPTVWEAIVSCKAGVDAHQSLEERLASHVNHVGVNTLDERRAVGPTGIPVLDHPVAARHAHASELRVDGRVAEALMIDSDPDLVGWATVVGATTLLIAVDRALVNPATMNVERLVLEDT